MNHLTFQIYSNLSWHQVCKKMISKLKPHHDLVTYVQTTAFGPDVCNVRMWSKTQGMNCLKVDGLQECIAVRLPDCGCNFYSRAFRWSRQQRAERNEDNIQCQDALRVEHQISTAGCAEVWADPSWWWRTSQLNSQTFWPNSNAEFDRQCCSFHNNATSIDPGAVCFIGRSDCHHINCDS